MIDGIELERCPLRSYYDDPERHNALMERYRWSREGMLLDPGTLLDQANAFVEYARVIATANEASSQVRKDNEERQRRQVERAQRLGGGGKGRRR